MISTSKFLINKYNLSQNPNGSYNANGNIWITNNIFHYNNVKINILNGNFSCVCANLTSLIYTPIYVNHVVFCYYNNLTNLDYTPISKKIYADYKIFNNHQSNNKIQLTNYYL